MSYSTLLLLPPGSQGPPLAVNFSTSIHTEHQHITPTPGCDHSPTHSNVTHIVSPLSPRPQLSPSPHPGHLAATLAIPPHLLAWVPPNSEAGPTVPHEDHLLRSITHNVQNSCQGQSCCRIAYKGLCCTSSAAITQATSARSLLAPQLHQTKCGQCRNLDRDHCFFSCFALTLGCLN